MRVDREASVTEIQRLSTIRLLSNIIHKHSRSPISCSPFLRPGADGLAGESGDGGGVAGVGHAGGMA